MPPTKGKLAKTPPFWDALKNSSPSVTQIQAQTWRRKQSSKQENNYSLEVATDNLNLEIELDILDLFCSLFRSLQ